MYEKDAIGFAPLASQVLEDMANVLRQILENLNYPLTAMSVMDDERGFPIVASNEVRHRQLISRMSIIVSSLGIILAGYAMMHGGQMPNNLNQIYVMVSNPHHMDYNKILNLLGSAMEQYK